MLFVKTIRAISRLLLSLLGSTEYIGQEHIPTEQPFLFVFNHMSVWDSLLVIVGMPAMEMRLFVAPGWQKAPILAQLAGRFGGIFVDKGAERKALRTALDAIKAGLPFGLAPEGTRSSDGALMRAKDGAAYLAVKAELPILPVAITGSEKLRWNFTHLHRSRLVVRFGPVFTLPDAGRRVRSRDLPAYSHLIMSHIAAQLPERYHGAYQGSPAIQALQQGEDPWQACLRAEEQFLNG